MGFVMVFVHPAVRPCAQGKLRRLHGSQLDAFQRQTTCFCVNIECRPRQRLLVCSTAGGRGRVAAAAIQGRRLSITSRLSALGRIGSTRERVGRRDTACAPSALHIWHPVLMGADVSMGTTSSHPAALGCDVVFAGVPLRILGASKCAKNHKIIRKSFRKRSSAHTRADLNKGRAAEALHWSEKGGGCAGRVGSPDGSVAAVGEKVIKQRRGMTRAPSPLALQRPPPRLPDCALSRRRQSLAQ